MEPTVGRIVHYQSYGTPNGEYMPEARAAVITTVEKYEPEGVGSGAGYVGLCILNPTGQFFNINVPHAINDVPTPGCWNWPPRV